MAEEVSLLAERSISELKKVVIALLKNENVKIMLFGSRARGNNYPYPDVDIGILPSGRFDEKKLTLLKEYLKDKEGVISNSPKSCFREAFSLGFLTEEETVKFLEMTDRRNDTSYTHKEEVAQIIYSKIPAYFLLMEGLLEKFMDKI